MIGAVNPRLVAMGYTGPPPYDPPPGGRGGDPRTERLRATRERLELRRDIVALVRDMVITLAGIPAAFAFLWATPELHNAPGIAAIGAFVTALGFGPTALGKLRERRANGKGED